MEEKDYPKVENTPMGWVVRPNERTKLPGVYTNQRRALKALDSYARENAYAAKQRAEKAAAKKTSKPKKAK